MEEKYYHTQESVNEYIKLSKGVNGSELIEKLKRFLPKKSKVLELGSGPGTDYALLNQDYQVIGSDYSEEFIHHLNSTYPSGEFIKLNAATLDTQELFDGIYANKVLHHLTDEELKSSVQHQHRTLNSRGIICLSFWKGEGTEEFKGMYVNYHTEEELRALFSTQFEILLLEPYKEFEEGDSLLLIGRKIN